MLGPYGARRIQREKGTVLVDIMLGCPGAAVCFHVARILGRNHASFACC